MPLLEPGTRAARDAGDPVGVRSQAPVPSSTGCAGSASRWNTSRAAPSTSGATSPSCRPPLNDGIEFFKALLDVQVITVPGVFFDVNPGQRRRNARYHSYCRLSFGPSMEILERGTERIEKLVRAHS